MWWLSLSEPIYLLSEEELVKYIQTYKKQHKLSYTDIGEILNLDRSNVSRALKNNFIDGVKAKRALNYSEAYQIIKFFRNRTSPFPQDKSLEDYYTNSEKVRGNGFVYSDETVGEASSWMRKYDYTQIVVKEKATDQCLGIITDYAILQSMLTPKVSKNSLEQLKKTKIKDSNLIDETPIFPLKSSLEEVAEGLMYHYAVLIKEENGDFGIITRWDYLQLIET